MKKLSTLAFSACALALLASPAIAQQAQDEFYFKPYVGADFQHIAIDYQSFEGISFDDVFEDRFNGGALYLGARVHENLGFEVGYSQTQGESRSNVLGTGVDTDVTLKSFTFDAVGFLPIDESWELIGSAGIARTKAEVEVDATAIGFSSARGDETETKLRLGAGAQYALTEALNARAMVRWQDADFDDSADHAFIYSVGLNYSF